MTDSVIGPAAPADLEQVAAIFAHYVTHTAVTFEVTPPGVADWRRRLDSLDSLGLPFLVARADAEVTGFAYAAPWRPKPAYRHTVEDSVYLAPGRTGQGLGRGLLAGLLARCRTAGVRQVVAVIADAGSDASVALHQRLGFIPVGRLTGVGYKHGAWIDTVLLQCDLTATRRVG
ncbi:MAG TPA: GNAT family N-acetyltransferase [Streptosporangiaceae bacterium]|nr:GNAT family N-acetyltransferase [Streptosporangiaceae bacterium]